LLKDSYIAENKDKNGKIDILKTGKLDILKLDILKIDRSRKDKNQQCV